MRGAGQIGGEYGGEVECVVGGEVECRELAWYLGRMLESWLGISGSWQVSQGAGMVSRGCLVSQGAGWD